MRVADWKAALLPQWPSLFSSDLIHAAVPPCNPTCCRVLESVRTYNRGVTKSAAKPKKKKRKTQQVLNDLYDDDEEGSNKGARPPGCHVHNRLGRFCLAGRTVCQLGSGRLKALHGMCTPPTAT